MKVTLHTGIHFSNWSSIKAGYPNLSARIRNATEVANPEFVQAQRMGRRTRGISPTIRAWHYDREADVLTIPMGYLPRLQRALHVMGIDPAAIEDKRALRLAPAVESNIKLRPYQEQATKAVQRTLRDTGLGLLVSPPGSGKTEMGLEIAARLGQSTLWITHTKDLANQARQRAIDRLGLSPAEIGMIGGGKATTGRFLTIGLVQSLSRANLAPMAERWGLIIIDEAHHAPARTWSKVIGALAARYRLALTGTLERQDGLHELTHLYFGPVGYEVERQNTPMAVVPRLETLGISGEEMVPAIWRQHEKRVAEFQQRKAEWKAGKLGKQPRKPHLNYTKLLDQLLTNHHRNKRIIKLLRSITQRRKTLVLSQRVSHCEELANWLAKESPHLRIEVIHGGQPALERAEIIKEAQDGGIDVLFSVNIAKEGLDVPCLDQLVFVAGGRDPIYVKQAIGRIQRPAKGKQDAVVWDVVDWDVGVLRNQYFARRRVYQGLGMLQGGGRRVPEAQAG